LLLLLLLLLLLFDGWSCHGGCILKDNTRLGDETIVTKETVHLAFSV